METPAFPLQSDFARRFADDWVNAWNAHDLERIVFHYADEIVLISPVALKMLNNADGAVRGKAALREYFSRGLQAYPEIHFDLIDVLWGVETIVLYYRNNVRGNKTAEVMQIGPDGRVQRVWANYDQ